MPRVTSLTPGEILLLSLPLPWPPVKTNFNFFQATWVGLKARSSTPYFPPGFLRAVLFRFILIQQKESEEGDMGIGKSSPSSPKYKWMTVLNLQQRNAHLIASDGQLTVQEDISGNLRVAHLVQTVSVWSPAVVLAQSWAQLPPEDSAVTEAAGYLFIAVLWSRKPEKCLCLASHLWDSITSACNITA